MYERFTDRSRNVMQLASHDAQRFHHEFIDTEHILVGLLSEGESVAGIVLKNLGINLEDIRREVRNLFEEGP